MTQAHESRPAGFSQRQKLGLTLFGGGLLILLAIAWGLEPNANGYGTHRQMGLPPCTFVVLFGQRCPSCGMTTSWAYLMRGDLARSFAANSGGTLLGLLAVVTGPWALVSGVRGRWLWGKPGIQSMQIVAAVVIVVTLIDWCHNLWNK